MDADGELTPVLMQAVQGLGDVGAVAGCLEMFALVAAVFFVETFGHENFHRLPDQLVRFVAENGFYLLVGKRDAAILLDDDHRVGRGVEDVAQVGFILLQCANITLEDHIDQQRAQADEQPAFGGLNEEIGGRRWRREPQEQVIGKQNPQDPKDKISRDGPQGNGCIIPLSMCRVGFSPV